MMQTKLKTFVARVFLAKIKVAAIFLFAAALLLTSLNCGKKAEKETKEITYPLETAKMVSEVTSGVISSGSAIKVRFVEPVVGNNLVGSTLSKQVFSFTPKIDGITKWEDTRTLAFQPNQPLPMREKYSGQLDMSLLFPQYKDKNLEPLEIQFEVAGREISSVAADFEPAKGNRPQDVVYKGTVDFTQPADSQAVKESMKLTIDGRNLSLIIHQRGNGEKFAFTSNIISRDDERKKLVFKIEKSKLELSADYEKTLYLEPLKEMKVSGVASREMGDEPVIQVNFTDELDPEQNIAGLISVQPAQDIKLKVSGKTVYVMGKFGYGETYTLTVHPGIRSKWGTKIQQETSQEVAFQDIKPQMRFVSSGAFLPTANQDKIAFQTVNLKQVRLEIMKVFDSNLGQFLQTEQLSSAQERNEAFNNWEMRRVGVNIVTDSLEIGNTRNTWLQSELDLQKILQADRKGLYIITLRFRKKDMLYTLEDEEDSHGRRRYYYGDAYYSNPNSSGYIYRHGQIFKPVVLSDIGLTYLQGHQQHVVYATNILDSKPMGGVQVQLRTYQNQVIASATTDGDGKALFEKTGQDVFYVQAERDGQRSVVKLNEMAWNMSSFDVEGAVLPPGGARVFIYTERGVYRPGDTLHISLIARNENNTFPTDHPVTLKVYNPKNQLVFETLNKNSRDGFYSFMFSTRQEDMTGNYKAEFLVGTQKFYHTLKIETVVPYRLKVNIEPQKNKLGPADKILRLDLSATYLFGNPAAGLRAEVNVDLENLSQRFKQFPGYTFTNQAMDYKSVSATVFNSDLSPEGKAHIDWQLPSFRNVPSSIQAKVNAKVYEKGGRASQSDVTIPIEPYNFYVGLEKPDFKYGYVQVGSAVSVNTVLVNTDGQPVPGQTLQYRIYKNNRYWWWEYDSRTDYQLRYKTDSHTELVEKGNIISQSIPAVIKFKPEDRGQYLVEVQAENGSGHTAGFFFNAYYWGESPGGKEAGAITLKTDRENYHPGETAVVTFPTPSEGSILIGVEKANKILNTRWIEPARNQNETQVQIPVTAEMLPTAYVSVSIIQPHSQTANDRPIRMYGVIPLNVEEASTRQEIRITMADELKSEKPFEVEIQTGDHKPTQFTISVVDEGLLALTNFRTPNPWDEFYKKLRLGVKIFDLFSDVIGANKGDIFRTFSIGGGMSAEKYRLSQQEVEKVKRFRPVCMFAGPQMTDPQGHAKISFRMPNYIGAVRVMVASATGNRYGSANKTVPVKTDLMVLPTLPRVLGPENSFVVPVTVFAMQDNIKTVIVSIKSTGPVAVTGEAQKTLSFEKSGEKDVYFNLRAAKAVGASHITITAVSGQLSATSETDLAVTASSPRIYDSEEKACKPGESIAFTIPNRGIQGTNHARINVMRMPKLNIGWRMWWLIHYPYGCIEQTVSSVFPQLYLKSFIKSKQETDKEIDKNINAGIERLRKFQVPSGGFAYWPGGKTASVWGTSYAGHFLIEAKKLGYHVPADLMDNWLRFEKAQALTTRDNLTERVYRVYLLAEAGEPQTGPMNLLKENSLKDMTDAEKWLLAEAYKLAGINNTAQQIAGKAGFTVKDYHEFSRTYGSGLRDEAIILEALVAFEQWPDATRIYKEITDALSTKNWYSTQTTGYALLALGKYIKANQGEFGDQNSVIAGTIGLPDGQKIEFDTKELKYSQEILSGFGDSVTVLLNEKTTLKQAYAVLEWDGVPLIPDVTAVSKNLAVNMDWYDDDGMPINPADLPQGKTFWGHFTAEKTSSLKLSIENLALVQVLPAGWEIENTRLSGESMPDWMRKWRLGRADYTDIRDDRIMWFFDMPAYSADKVDFVVKLNAVTVGEFWLPPTIFEAMYNNDYKAVVPGKKVTVSRRVK